MAFVLNDFWLAFRSVRFGSVRGGCASPFTVICLRVAGGTGKRRKDEETELTEPPKGIIFHIFGFNILLMSLNAGENK